MKLIIYFCLIIVFLKFVNSLDCSAICFSSHNYEEFVKNNYGSIIFKGKVDNIFENCFIPGNVLIPSIPKTPSFANKVPWNPHFDSIKITKGLKPIDKYNININSYPKINCLNSTELNNSLIIKSRENKNGGLRFGTWSFETIESFTPPMDLNSGFYFILGRWHVKNFAHIHEEMFRIFILQRNLGISPSESTLVVMDDVANFFQFENLFAKNVIRGPLKENFYKNVIIPGVYNPIVLDQVNTNDLLEFKKFILNSLKIIPNFRSNEPLKTLIISRNSTGNRLCINEYELKESLINMGYDADIVEPHLYSYLEQVKMFSNANIIISSHSGSLLQSLWLPPNSIVFQLHTYNTYYGTDEYFYNNSPPPYILNVENLTKKLNLKYLEYIYRDDEYSKDCKNENEIKRNRNLNGGNTYKCYFKKDFVVDVNYIIEKIEETLEESHEDEL